MNKWVEIDYGGLKMFEETEMEWREATVIQGGNNLWSAYVHQGRRGRLKLRGNGRIAGKPTHFEHMKPQSKTRDEGRIWAEEVWMRLPELQ